MNNDRYIPKNLERDIMVLDMTLSGFSDKEIAEAMGINHMYCTRLRGRVLDMLLAPSRLNPKSITTRDTSKTQLVLFKDIWIDRLNFLKMEFGLIDARTICA